MHHTSLFGDATYQVNVNRQTKLRRQQSLPSDNTVAKVREFTVATMKAIIAKQRKCAAIASVHFVAGSGPVPIDLAQFQKRRRTSSTSIVRLVRCKA